MYIVYLCFFIELYKWDLKYGWQDFCLFWDFWNDGLLTTCKCMSKVNNTGSVKVLQQFLVSNHHLFTQESDKRILVKLLDNGHET